MMWSVLCRERGEAGEMADGQGRGVFTEYAYGLILNACVVSGEG
jgi:hypothetical protein